MTSADKLNEIATLFGSKVKQSNVLGRGLTFEWRNYKGFRIRLSTLQQMIEIEIKAESSIAAAFNQPDTVCLINQPLFIEYPTRIFVSSMEAEKDVSELAVKIRPQVEKINLAHSESIVIYKNQISVELDPNRDVVPAIDKIIEIILLNKQDSKDGREHNDLPDNLKDLNALFDRYSISDDEDRDELIKSMTDKEINNLIGKVDERWDDINTFLGSFRDQPLSENAQSLMSLAELVTELKNKNQ